MRAAAISLNITPRESLELGAPGTEGGRGRRTAEPLEASIMAIWDDSGLPLVVISLDLLYPGEPLSSQIRQELNDIPSERIVITATHTHRAPMTDATKPGLGAVDPNYLRRLTEVIVANTRRVLSAGQTIGTVRVGSATAGHSINRRGRTRFPLSRLPQYRGEVSLAPHAGGTVDEIVNALVVEDEQRRPLAVLWNYACHPVAYPLRDVYAAHFPEAVRAALRRHYGDPRLPVLYMQGFSGNTRPTASAVPRSVKGCLKRILGGPVFDDISRRRYARWSESLSSVVTDVVSRSDKVEPDEIVAFRVELPSNLFVTRGAGPVSFFGAHFGTSLSVVGVGAEVVAEYAHVIRQLNPGKQLMLVGCADSPFGYAPTKSMLKEGGYEAGGFTKVFGVGDLNPEIEQNVLSGLRQVSDGFLDIPERISA